MNHVTLSGHLGVQPELRYTSKGTAIMNLRLATNERVPDNERGWKDQTEWHSVVVWGSRGEGLMKVLDKGSHILVEGKLRTRFWQDSSNIRHYVTEVHATNVELLGGTKKNDSTEQPSPSNDEEPPFTDENSPF